MYKFVRTAATTGCLLIAFAAMAQPAKNKPVKPVAKPAPAVKKIDYAKLKTDIRSLYRSEDYKAVIPKAAQYLAQNPKDTQVTMQKAVSHVILKQYDAGFSMVKNFFTPADTAAKYLAIMAFQMPDSLLTSTGLLCAEEAVKILPNGPWGYFAKAGIYSDKQDHDKALPVMEEMNKRLRNDAEEKLLAPFYAKELAMSGQYDKALASIDPLYKKYPGDFDIMDVYAYVYRRSKNYDKAVEKYDEMMKLFPDNINIGLAKARMLFDAGNTAACCAATESVIAADSMYSFLRYRYKCPAYFATPAINGIKSATWAVDFSGNNYDFSVSNIKGNTDEGMEFDWSMNSGDDMNGHITLTKEAMAGAVAQNNRFSASMKNIVLKDQTTVWVSKGVMEALLSKGAAKMDAGYGEEEYKVVPNNAEQGWDNEALEDKIVVKGEPKYLSTIHVQNSDGTHQMWILNDVKNPLIIKMQFDWGIQLKTID